MEVKIVSILISSDNFSYVISQGDDAVVIDASDAPPILEHINKHSLNLLAVLSTHRHSDHTRGNLALKQATGCKIAAIDERTAGIDKVLTDGESVSFDKITFKVMHVPGHTKFQAAYLLEESKCVFTGDTLFGAGCGRIFEGNADAMFHSLEKLASLPERTKVYFGHEYTKH
ncbi:MAG: MBL fold metallo-hydrolase [Chitinispirillales bacterium]|jgi:hydroxyacylglutathione hydrolase|nr:MBL fold metallo-hydrolase [Chitinispirillales bacterium]